MRRYIPTLCRSDKQITFDNLPKFLQDKTTLVVQPHEEHLYNGYPILVLPEDWIGISRTRKIIMEHADDSLFGMLDDDIELILYNAGADCYKDDLIGKMNLEKKTLEKRDKVIYDFCFDTCKNIVTVLGGGYAKNIKDTVDIYYNTFTESFNLWKNYRG